MSLCKVLVYFCTFFVPIISNSKQVMASAFDIFGDCNNEDDFLGFSWEVVAIFDQMNQNGDDNQIGLAESDDSESEGDEPANGQEPPAPFINWNNNPSEVQVPEFTEHVGPTRQQQQQQQITELMIQC